MVRTTRTRSTPSPTMTNHLFYGDNLNVMREKLPDAKSVDLVYLDPPFKSDLNYNLLFKTNGLHPDEAQMTAFKDTWIWDEGASVPTKNRVA